MSAAGYVVPVIRRQGTHACVKALLAEQDRYEMLIFCELHQGECDMIWRILLRDTTKPRDGDNLLRVEVPAGDQEFMLTKIKALL